MHNRVGGRQQPAVAPKASTVNWIVVAVREALFQLQPRVVCKSQRFGREFAEHRPSTVKRVECAVMGDGDWGKKCTLILHFNGKTVRKDMSMVSSWSGSATRRWLLCWAADLLSQLFGLHQTTVIRRRLFRFISVIVSFLFLLYQSVSYPYCRCSGTHKVEQECSTRSWLYSVLNSSDDVILFVEKKNGKNLQTMQYKKKMLADFGHIDWLYIDGSPSSSEQCNTRLVCTHIFFPHWFANIAVAFALLTRWCHWALQWCFNLGAMN